jgi:hypothetical protein
MIKLYNSTVVNVWSAMVSRFCIRPTSKKWFLKIVQLTMKHDPINIRIKAFGQNTLKYRYMIVAININVRIILNIW